MATNRFDVGLNPIQIGTPVQIPFEEIVGALGAKQEAYNQSKNLLQALDEKVFQNLQVDADFAAKARQEQSQLVDNLLQMNQGDLAKGAPDIEREIRKFARRYGPSGDIGAIQSSYNKAAEEFKKIDASDVPVDLKQKAKQELLHSYGNVEKNAYKDAFGNTIYNQFGDAYVPEYVNVSEEALKLAKEVPIEKIAQTTGWYKNGYTWYKDSSMVEKVTFDDIVQAITPFVEGNPKAKDYLAFEAKMNTFHLGEPDIATYNEQLRRETADSNETLLRKKGEIITKLNDPSKFKSVKEYQNYINSVFGKQVVKADGVIGDATQKAKERAMALVNEKMVTTPYEQKDLSGIRKDYINQTINNAIQGAAGFYEQYNITKKDQDMKFDPWIIHLMGEKLKDEITVGELTPTLAKQQPFEGSPLSGGIAKVKNGEIILEQSKKAQTAIEQGQMYAHPSTMHLNPGAYLWSKVEGAWHSMFSKDRMDASNPDVANAINNTKHRLEQEGINTEGYTEQDWLELVAKQMETKQDAAGQEFYNQVMDEKSKNNWEGVWSEKVRKEGKQAFFTDPFLLNREVHGTVRVGNTTRVTGDDLSDKIKANGPISYGGTNFDVASSMEYGTDVIKIGVEEFYVEPSPSTKMSKEYFANGILRARFGLGDTNYFEGYGKTSNGVPALVNYRSEYHADDGTYKVQVQSGKEWKDMGTFTDVELLNSAVNE